VGISTASILFVDDDPCMREVMALILNEEGYEVSGAEDGLDALIRLRDFVPDLIISDLHMPRMSGVEFLSVVRRRFPAIPVIAISGAYDPCESSAAGVMADAFFPKGGCKPDGLVETIRRLIYEPLKRPTNYHPCNPQRVQLARRGLNREGLPVLQLTCTECLRTLSATSVSGSDEGDFMVRCQSCGAQVHFVCDLAKSSPMAGVITAGTPVGLPAQ
jgi:CheY-like chemotaxis protein